MTKLAASCDTSHYLKPRMADGMTLCGIAILRSTHLSILVYTFTFVRRHLGIADLAVKRPAILYDVSRQFLPDSIDGLETVEE